MFHQFNNQDGNAYEQDAQPTELELIQQLVSQMIALGANPLTPAHTAALAAGMPGLVEYAAATALFNPQAQSLIANAQVAAAIVAEMVEFRGALMPHQDALLTHHNYPLVIEAARAALQNPQAQALIANPNVRARILREMVDRGAQPLTAQQAALLALPANAHVVTMAVEMVNVIPAATGLAANLTVAAARAPAQNQVPRAPSPR